MKPPTTYAEWACCCDRLLKGDCDDETLTVMASGRIEWTSGVAERTTKRISEVFDTRLKRLSEQLQRDLDRSAGHETLLTNALLGVRKNLLILVRLSTLPVLPEVVTKTLKQFLVEYVERAQSSLENTARNDRTGRLLSIIRRTPVCIPSPDPAPASTAAAASGSQPVAEPGVRLRHIILK